MVLASAPQEKLLHLKVELHVIISNSLQLELTKMDIPTEWFMSLQHSLPVFT